MKYLLFALLAAATLFFAAGQKFVFGQTTTTSPTQMQNQQNQSNGNGVGGSSGTTTTPSGAPSTGLGGLAK